jgi:putative sigma-54 modulation protein
MNVVIHPVHFDASEQLIEFINKKLSKLESFFDKIVEAEVFLKVGTKQNIKDKIVEIKLMIPGKTLFVSETSKTFEASTDIALDIMSRQLVRHKERQLEKF